MRMRLHTDLLTRIRAEFAAARAGARPLSAVTVTRIAAEATIRALALEVFQELEPDAPTFILAGLSGDERDTLNRYIRDVRDAGYRRGHNDRARSLHAELDPRDGAGQLPQIDPIVSTKAG